MKLLYVAGLTIDKVPKTFTIGNGVETIIRDPQNMACIIIAYELNVYGSAFFGFYQNNQIVKISGSSEFSTSDDGSKMCIYVKSKAIYAKINGAGGGSLKVRFVSANSI